MLLYLTGCFWKQNTTLLLVAATPLYVILLVVVILPLNVVVIVAKQKILMRSFTSFKVRFCFCFCCCCACTHLLVCTSLVCTLQQCVQMFTSLCGARCAWRCVQKTKAKPPPPPKLRGKGIIAKKEPKDRKSPKRAMDRGYRKQGKRTDIDVTVPKLSKVRTNGTSMFAQRTP